MARRTYSEPRTRLSIWSPKSLLERVHLQSMTQHSTGPHTAQ